MNGNTALIFVSSLSIFTGVLVTATVVVSWPPPVRQLIVLGPVCLIWGVAMLWYALAQR